MSEYNISDIKTKYKEDPENTRLAVTILQRYEELKSLRYPYEPVWDEITEYVLPSLGSFNYTESRLDPERRTRRRLDPTAVIAARTLTSRVIADMTGPGSRWFDFRVPNPQIDQMDPVRRFLQGISDKTFSIMNTGSFRMAHIEATTDWIAYGTACLMREEEDGEIRFTSIPPQQLYIAEDKHNVVDTVFRKFKLSVRQIGQFFGKENLPKSTLSELHENPDSEMEVLHCVYPNEDYDDKKVASKYMKFKSVFLLKEELCVLKIGGFNRMPYHVFRFWKRSGEVYCGSPAIDSLADIRMLNLMEEANIRSVQLDAFPPLLMAHDSVVMPLKVYPNGTNYGGMSSDGRRLVDRLFPSGGDKRSLETMLEQKRMAIRSAFFVDPLINRENSIRTAAEVAKRSNEEMVGISPFLSRYEVEYLTPVLDDLLNYVLRTEKPEVPEALDGMVPFIEYTAPLAKTQRAQELNNILQFLQVTQNLAQVAPETLQNLDINTMFHRLADLFGVPLDVIKPEAVIQAERAQMEQQQAQQQQMQQLEGGLGSITSQMAELAKSGLLKREDLGLPPGE